MTPDLKFNLSPENFQYLQPYMVVVWKNYTVLFIIN